MDAQLPGQADHPGDPHLLEELDGDDVAGIDQAVAQGGGAQEIVFEVVGFPCLAGNGAGQRQGGIVDDGGGGEAARQGGGVDDRFKCRAWLPPCLGGAVVLAAVKAAPPHHRPYLATCHVHGDEGGLGPGGITALALSAGPMVEAVGQTVGRGQLQRLVQGGLNGEAVLGQGLLAVLLVDIVADLLEEITIRRLLPFVWRP